MRGSRLLGLYLTQLTQHGHRPTGQRQCLATASLASSGEPLEQITTFSKTTACASPFTDAAGQGYKAFSQGIGHHVACQFLVQGAASIKALPARHRYGSFPATD